jgi:hypothetical protein
MGLSGIIDGLAYTIEYIISSVGTAAYTVSAGTADGMTYHPGTTGLTLGGSVVLMFVFVYMFYRGYVKMTRAIAKMIGALALIVFAVGLFLVGFTPSPRPSSYNMTNGTLANWSSSSVIT